MTGGRRLTWRGFQRRQHRVAGQVLEAYFSEPVVFRLISSSTNFIYLVRSHAGAHFVLRLAFPGWRSPEDADLEVAWLDALARDTSIPAPRVVRALDGSAVYRLEDPFDGGRRHAVLMTRLPGMLLGRRLNRENMFKMGALFAKLHIHTAAWRPPEGLAKRRFDRFLSRGEPELIFGEDRLAACAPEDVTVLRRTAERVNRTYAALDPADLRVIHCDLWHDNIRLYRGQLAPFDFEDAILGYRLHDIAMAMLDLAEDTNPETCYSSLLPAFRAGYESLLEWPEGSLETLQMGRVLWRLNWVARHQPGRYAGAVSFYAGLIRRWEDTGRLIAPLKPA